MAASGPPRGVDPKSPLYRAIWDATESLKIDWPLPDGGRNDEPFRGRPRGAEQASHPGPFTKEPGPRSRFGRSSSPRRETRVLATPTIAPKVVIPAVPQPLPNPPPPAPITPWVVEPPAPITLKLVPLPISSEEQDLQLLLSWANTWPAHWETLVGLYFVEGRHPGSVLPLEKMGQVYCFRRDLRKEDMFAADPYSVDVWRLPEGEDSLVIQQAAVWVGQGRQAVFEEGIRRWVPTLRPIIGQVAPLLPFMAKAMWSNTNVAGFFDPDWWDMNKLKQMAEGPEKGALLESVRVNSPRVHAARMNDSICGALPDYRENSKRKQDQEEEKEERARKVAKMLPGQGRRTQFHAVPVSERAFDENGNRLPWGLEGPDDFRNPRRAPEEKGPFGTGGRRGKSRTKATTPAKKEDPNLLYFDQALAFDQKKKAQAALEEQAQSNNASSRSRSALTASTGNSNSAVVNFAPEPVEVILYGFQSEKQYAAIEHFEKISRGLICEDYPRQPPFERMRYQSSINITKAILPRSLTREESSKARNYAGGHSWIKVTFDSRQAADRAIYYSPQELNGRWVYAEPYKGTGPVDDAEIPVTADDRDQGLLGASKPTRSGSQTLRSNSSAQFTSATNGAQRAATLPTSFITNTMSQAQPPETSSLSSSTASSATATGYPTLPRSSSQADTATSSSLSTQQPTDSVMSCRLIPGATRAILRPAEEALLPQPSWSQRMITQLPFARWYNGDIIGDQVPRLDNGEFDWVRASFWWRICYWLDTHIGTNLCGMKDE